MEEKNNKMTINKLAEMTQKGFEALGDKVENEIGGLRNEMKSELRNEIGGLRNKLRDEMDEKFGNVLNNQDQILKRLDNLESDNTMDTAVHRRQGDKLENHEKRIVVVEEKLKVDAMV